MQYFLLIFFLIPTIVHAEDEPLKSAVIEVHLSQLEEQIRNLTGKLEEMEFANRTLSKKFEKFVADSELRFKILEKRKQTSHNTKNTIKTIQSHTANQEYDKAFSLLSSENYESAATAFQEFIKNHPSDTLTGNAYYWLAETYYVRKDFDQASIHFMKGYKSFPKGRKASGSLLKLAMSLRFLGKKKAACTTLKKLSMDFPQPSIAIANRMKSEDKILKCLK